MSDFRRRLLKKTAKNIYANDGCVTFFGAKLGYIYDTTFPEGLNFVMYDTANNVTDGLFYVGNFDALFLDEDGVYWIKPRRVDNSAAVSIGRWLLSLDDYSTTPWRLYSNRNIGNTALYYNVPVYSLETSELLYEANYDEADYY